MDFFPVSEKFFSCNSVGKIMFNRDELCILTNVLLQIHGFVLCKRLVLCTGIRKKKFIFKFWWMYLEYYFTTLLCILNVQYENLTFQYFTRNVMLINFDVQICIQFRVLRKFYIFSEADSVLCEVLCFHLKLAKLIVNVHTCAKRNEYEIPSLIK